MMYQPEETYEKPRLVRLGEVSNLTLGNGGSSLDGTGLNNQLGGGNDDNPGAVKGGQKKQN